VIQNHIHVPAVDFLDHVLPCCNVAKVQIQECQIYRLRKESATPSSWSPSSPNPTEAEKDVPNKNPRPKANL
jgi:hypothetical protein